jgi:cobalamin synthase
LTTLAGATLAGGIVNWLALDLSANAWLRIATVVCVATIVTCGWLRWRLGAMTGDILGATVCAIELCVVAVWPWLAS